MNSSRSENNMSRQIINFDIALNTDLKIARELSKLHANKPRFFKLQFSDFRNQIQCNNVISILNIRF